jgi:hypothetical protein
MSSDFEAHITFDRKNATLVKDALTLIETNSIDHTIKGWKFSQMDGDPVFGEGAFCYVTGNADDGEHAELEIQMDIIAEIIAVFGAPYIRKKIERTVVDYRFSRKEQ